MNALCQNRSPIPKPAIAARQFGLEIVAIDPRSNMVRMFNETGSRIWQLLDGSHSVEEIAHILAEEYAVSAVQAAVSVNTFLGQLQERGLVEWLLQPDQAP